MKGIINRNTDVFASPNTNAQKLQTLTVQDIVQIKRPITGDTIEGDDSWYEIDNDRFVWAGAVEVDAECPTLTDEDKTQYIVSFIEVDDFGKPKLLSDRAPDQLSFMPVRLPVEEANVRLNPMPSGFFVNRILQDIDAMQTQRTHVFIYIHGFQLRFMANMKLDLLNHFAQNYMAHPENAIAKVIFLMWPSQGRADRKEVDDDSIRAGEEFTQKGFFSFFTELSQQLKQRGKFLNLVVHSFGLQFLNGMTNPLPNGLSTTFEHIFLMAPDITHMAIQKDVQPIPNNFKRKNSKDPILYNLENLKKISNHIHIFHDQNDFLLYASTKKFVGAKALDQEPDTQERQKKSNLYRNLGNYGDFLAKQANKLQDGFTFFNLADLIKGQNFTPTNQYPFRLQNPATLRDVAKILQNADYKGVGSLAILVNNRQYTNYHRYVFTCRVVVDKVLNLLRQPQANDNEPPVIAAAE